MTTPKKKVTTTRASRTPRTKDELNTELSKLSFKLDSEEVADPKSLEASKARTAELREAVKTISADNVLKSIGGVNLEVSKLFSSISEALVQQANQLETVNEAVSLAAKDLEELHGKEVVASSLAVLLEEYDAKKVELDALRASTEEAWKAEQVLAAKLAKEQKDELQKQRVREQQEYDYTLSKYRQKLNDEFSEKMAEQEKQNREKQEVLLKTWTAREQALAAKEAELADLKKQVEDFPTKLAAEVKREVAIATNSQKKEHEFATQMAATIAASQAALAKQTITALEAARTEQANTIADLQRQLVEAKKQVTDIASKALDSASGAVALERVTSFQRNSDNSGKTSKA